MERLARLSRRARDAASEVAASAQAKARDVAAASAAPEMPLQTVSVPKTPDGFGLIVRGDASVAPGSACALVPPHATIVQAGDQPISNKADLITAIAGTEVGSFVDFTYRERAPPPEQRLVAKLPDGVLKDALPGMLSSARGFVEAEIMPEAANLQEKYKAMQAERAKEAEAQAAARALWEAAGKRKCVVVHPTVVRAGYSADSEELLPLRPGERLAILEERPVPGEGGTGGETGGGGEEPEPEPEPEPAGESATRKRISFRILGSDDLLGGAPPGGCWANTISEEGAVLVEEIFESDRKQLLATLEERARAANVEGAAAGAVAAAAEVAAAAQEAAAAASERIAPIVEQGKEAAAPLVARGVERVEELREKVQQATSSSSASATAGAGAAASAAEDGGAIAKKETDEL